MALSHVDFDIGNGMSPPGSQLQLYTLDGYDVQYFYFEPTGDKLTYSIHNKATRYCVEVLNSTTANWSQVGSNYLTVYGQSPRMLFRTKLWLRSVQVSGSDIDAIQTPEVNIILWGNITDGDRLPDFYISLTQSTVFEMLKQYGVKGGSYNLTTQFPITNSPALPQKTDKDTITKYLQSLIKNGNLTPNNNTVYVIFFDSTSGPSCKDYCSAHGWIQLKDKVTVKNTVLPGYVPFVLLPELTSGCDCCQGFDGLTANSAHEFVEVITEGYYERVIDTEIGDQCRYDLFKIPGRDGQTSYTVQKFWSNIANACVGGDSS
ncbi:hypothetical protein HDU76_004517 [Blyttiomyces sp. JEL0837]|nr:hypothetical protein HDU76_004517 [Blyttiomyces sp. JEL0837]